ncbi:hypothetical protein [Streptomyces sp. NPDC054940]
MKSWRSRAVAALSIGAAIVTIPLAAGSASADTVPRYRYNSTYKHYVDCQTAGNKLAQQGRITQFRCTGIKVISEWQWDLFVR